MSYKYSQFYDEPYTYNGGLHQFDPDLAVPVESDHADYGQTLKQVLGMTDAERDTIVTAQKWKQVRAYRDKLLAESDWTQGEDVPSAIKSTWTTYRQALRDITSGGDPDNLTWPTKP